MASYKKILERFPARFEAFINDKDSTLGQYPEGLTILEIHDKNTMVRVIAMTCGTKTYHIAFYNKDERNKLYINSIRNSEAPLRCKEVMRLCALKILDKLQYTYHINDKQRLAVQRGDACVLSMVLYSEEQQVTDTVNLWDII